MRRRLDVQKYWVHVRRAMLRAPIDRIGLRGYLNLTEGFPDFVETSS
ncbi:1,3-beta-galactosyl-N-acetylhexosamine phosphorylase N-terminal domain-containing protein [Sphaerochaeta halotolerans]|jgi:beta-D-galactosyl-(1->4)-L-rhamnose phosphorylase